MQTNFKQFRLALNLSQSELAEKVGVSRIYINKIERNIVFPSMPILKRISKVLNVCTYKLINPCVNCTLEDCCENFFYLCHNQLRYNISK
ncbi:helix-turn-helix transcriptional regulator [Clostridium magnum]|uniref:HTH-type transcriptional regulator SinR n=1 Tax=Clostridium magnum DSM 2767 TaxID=1121326 RepID=A0A162UXU7_9CLOT|nr:HTH-type transcriptional regulator SinR [Clostridium magnum DSM 2767]SHJ59003.1 DNA-binding transcriptional regulator, XRE-family HTH domain [Clostridium magnum DSM 2767]